MLLSALIELFEERGIKDVNVKKIGVRHGEKLFESLLGAEEMAKAEDLGQYFRVPLDTRTLDYDLFFQKGDDQDYSPDSYNSHNTVRLGKEEVKALVMTIPEFRKELGI